MKILFTIASLALAATAAVASTDKIIPAVAKTAGANNTFFQSDLRLVNTGATDASVDLIFLPSNVDDTNPTTVTLTVGARTSRQVDDALGSLFQQTNAGGALRVKSSSDVIVESRTYTPSATCPGSYGQYIPGIDATRAATRQIIPGVRLSKDSTTGFRSNVGIVNVGVGQLAVTLTLRDAEGGSLATAMMTAPPFSHTQTSVATLFAQTSSTNDNAFLELSAATGFLAYVSVVDNSSGDSIFIPADLDPGTPRTVQLITARQWSFSPSTIEVVAGQLVTLQFKAIDIEHGVGVSGVGAVSCSNDQGGQCLLTPNQIVTVSFTPRDKGTFAFFCTRFCFESADGTQGHLTMRGTIVVK
ncbi:MAG TPA: hypothetical protein VHL58_20220 [Thermoanaerobaculia bacterium]|nr:hypothetical protein [Thermoanaerobaculia bacterium]